MTKCLDKKSLFTTQIPQDERLCLFCKKKKKKREKNTNLVMEDENMFYCTVLGMNRLEKNYIIA